jgi:redox-sensitive bicupin YhaK (pirin superfamily)
MGDRAPDRLAPVIVRRDAEIHRQLLEGREHVARMHFSYGTYQDPVNMGIGVLRAFNHELFPENARLEPHPHSHAQRITYVIAGELEHSDRELDAARLGPGGVERTTLSSGADSLEWNPSPGSPLEVLQIWLALRGEPDPHVEQRQYRLDDRHNRWLAVAHPHGQGGSGVNVDSDASIHVTHLDPSASVGHTLAAGHGGYAYVISGDADLNGHRLHSGDAVLITGDGAVLVEAHAPTELILVDTAL